MSRGTALPSSSYVRPSRRRLRSAALPRRLIEVTAVRMKTFWIIGYPQNVLRRR